MLDAVGAHDEPAVDGGQRITGRRKTKQGNPKTNRKIRKKPSGLDHQVNS
jgi:hypothetical protein